MRPDRSARYERSTAAHNTLTVDGADSTEVWGAFRAARLAQVSGARAHADSGVITVEAEHDGFARLPGRPRHRRRWSLTPAGLRVDDLVTGQGQHEVVVHWHLAPGPALRSRPGRGGGHHARRRVPDRACTEQTEWPSPPDPPKWPAGSAAP